MKLKRFVILFVFIFVQVQLWAQPYSHSASYGSTGGGISKTTDVNNVSVVGQTAVSNYDGQDQGYAGNIGFLTLDLIPNQAPLVDAGVDTTYNEGDLITLDGSYSSDPEGDSLSFIWVSLDGITLPSTSSPTISFDAPDVAEKEVYRFILTVHDGQLSSPPDTVTIKVIDPFWYTVPLGDSSWIYGKVTINGMPADSGDVVIACVDGVNRGKTEVIFMDGMAIADFRIYTEMPEVVRFKVYDLSEDQICQVEFIAYTNPDGEMGNPFDPLPIAAECGLPIIETQLSASVDTLFLGIESGSVPFNVFSDTTWSAVENSDWFSIDPLQGIYDSTISVVYIENPDSTDRIGEIFLSAPGAEEIFVYVFQEGRPQLVDTSLSASISTLTLGSSTGQVSFKIFSNTQWFISESANWFDVTPVVGIGDTVVTINYEANLSEELKTETITISGIGVADITITIQQAGKTPPPGPYVRANPSRIDIDALSGVDSTLIESNVEWEVQSNTSWINFSPSSGQNDSTLVIQFEENPLGIVRLGTITLTTDGLDPFKVEIYQAGNANVPVPQPNWPVSTTNENHTIVVVENLESDIDGYQLQIGDYIGLFYESAGQYYPGGMVRWEGQATSFPVYGNNASAPDKNGFDNGEAFTVKVWRAADSTTLDVEGQFLPFGPNFTHEGNYANDGFSGLAGLRKAEGINIELKEGWNMISSYIIPQNPNMLDLVSDIEADVRIIKDELGNAAVPSLGINNIGDWSIVEGYKIKVSKDVTLNIQGGLVDPNATPIPINEGWQIIPYLKTQANDVVSALSNIEEKISLVKDIDGNTYIPLFAINNLGDLNPTQGYQLKSIGTDTLFYSSDPLPAVVIDQNGTLDNVTRHYFTTTEPTGSDATILFPKAVIEPYLNSGDEIGVFDADGHVYGAAQFEGENLAITIRGDDKTTPVKEGLYTNEAFSLKLWKSVTREEIDFKVLYENISAHYQGDGIYLAKDILDLPIKEITIDNFRFRCYPNPVTTDRLTFELQLPDSGEVRLAVISENGQLIDLVSDEYLEKGKHEWIYSTKNLTAGLYFYQIKTSGQVKSGKFNLIR